MYLISACFDEKSNRKMRRWIEQIALRTGNTFMTDNHVPPHLTISSIEARSGEVLLDGFKALEGEVSAGRIQFVSVGMLLPYVLYATPVLNPYLLKLSETIYDQFSDVDETTVSKYYQPLQWLPHATLGKTLTKEQMQTAIAFLQDDFAPFEAEVVSLGLAKTNPHEDLMRITL